MLDMQMVVFGCGGGGQEMGKGGGAGGGGEGWGGLAAPNQSRAALKLSHQLVTASIPRSYATTSLIIGSLSRNRVRMSSHKSGINFSFLPLLRSAIRVLLCVGQVKPSNTGWRRCWGWYW